MLESCILQAERVTSSAIWGMPSLRYCWSTRTTGISERSYKWQYNKCLNTRAPHYGKERKLLLGLKYPFFLPLLPWWYEWALQECSCSDILVSDVARGVFLILFSSYMSPFSRTRSELLLLWSKKENLLLVKRNIFLLLIGLLKKSSFVCFS